MFCFFSDGGHVSFGVRKLSAQDSFFCYDSTRPFFIGRIFLGFKCLFGLYIAVEGYNIPFYLLFFAFLNFSSTRVLPLLKFFFLSYFLVFLS